MLVTALAMLCSVPAAVSSEPDEATPAEPSISELLPVGRRRSAEEVLRAQRLHGATVPDDATLEAAGAVIGNVRIRVGDIFDPEVPEEDRLLFRIANRLHLKTRERVIRRLLLFRSGDSYSRRLLEESERLLRATKYLYDARIFPVRYEDGRVDVEVVTRDVWTLQVGVGFSRTGGENTTRLGIQDSNFFGTGTEVTLRRIEDVERTTHQYRFRDPNLLGSRVFLRLWYEDNSDGLRRDLWVERPFYSLDARWAAAFRAIRDDRIRPLYELGEVIDEFRHLEDRYEVFSGLSSGLRDRATRRWSLGFTYERDRFRSLPARTTGALPSNRTLVWPWVELHWVRDGFIEIHDLDRIQRTEDLNLGHDLRARLGWTVSAFDSQPGRAMFDLRYLFGAGLGRAQILLAGTHASGRLHDGIGENVLVGGKIRYYRRDLGRHVFFAMLQADAAHRLDGERQLLLGGDNGLRGYPLRYASGDRRLLLTLEQRFYTDWHVLRLAHVGAAVFLDVGRAWFADSPDTGLGVLRDVGFGLRIGSSRSASAAMVHIDVAFPLDGGRSIDHAQLVVTTRETF